jgi:hypothetical protein
MKRSLLFKCLRVARSHRENTAIPSTEGLSEGHCHNPLQNNGLENGYSRSRSVDGCGEVCHCSSLIATLARGNEVSAILVQAKKVHYCHRSSSIWMLCHIDEIRRD